jgi:Kef-type K+ transport system membrane component KefB
VPVFLFVIGTELNFKELVALPDASGVVVVVSLSAIALKIITGFVGGIAIGLKKVEAFVIGICSSAKLSVSFAAIYAGYEAHLVNQQVFSAVVLSSLIGSLIAPLALNIVKLFKGLA